MHLICSFIDLIAQIAPFGTVLFLVFLLQWQLFACAKPAPNQDEADQAEEGKPDKPRARHRGNRKAKVAKVEQSPGGESSNESVHSTTKNKPTTTMSSMDEVPLRTRDDDRIRDLAGKAFRRHKALRDGDEKRKKERLEKSKRKGKAKKALQCDRTQTATGTDATQVSKRTKIEGKTDATIPEGESDLKKTLTCANSSIL